MWLPVGLRSAVDLAVWLLAVIVVANTSARICADSSVVTNCGQTGATCNDVQHVTVDTMSGVAYLTCHWSGGVAHFDPSVSPSTCSMAMPASDCQWPQSSALTADGTLWASCYGGTGVVGLSANGSTRKVLTSCYGTEGIAALNLTLYIACRELGVYVVDVSSSIATPWVRVPRFDSFAFTFNHRSLQPTIYVACLDTSVSGWSQASSARCTSAVFSFAHDSTLSSAINITDLVGPFDCAAAWDITMGPDVVAAALPGFPNATGERVFVACGPSGVIAVTVWHNGTVMTESIITSADNSTGFSIALGVAFDADTGTLYASMANWDSYNGHVVALWPDGHVSEVVNPTTCFEMPWGLAVNPVTRSLHVACYNEPLVVTLPLTNRPSSPSSTAAAATASPSAGGDRPATLIIVLACVLPSVILAVLIAVSIFLVRRRQRQVQGSVSLRNRIHSTASASESIGAVNVQLSPSCSCIATVPGPGADFLSKSESDYDGAWTDVTASFGAMTASIAAMDAAARGLHASGPHRTDILLLAQRSKALLPLLHQTVSYWQRDYGPGVVHMPALWREFDAARKLAQMAADEFDQVRQWMQLQVAASAESDAEPGCGGSSCQCGTGASVSSTSFSAAHVRLVGAVEPLHRWIRVSTLPAQEAAEIVAVWVQLQALRHASTAVTQEAVAEGDDEGGDGDHLHGAEVHAKSDPLPESNVMAVAGVSDASAVTVVVGEPQLLHLSVCTPVQPSQQ